MNNNNSSQADSLTEPLGTHFDAVARKVDCVLLGIATLAMCGQVDVRRFGRDTLAEGLGYATKTFGLSFADVLFAALFVWFILRTAQLKAWRKLWWPPLPCFALVFALIVSTLHSPTIAAQIAEQGKLITKESKDALADIVQWGGYFLVAPWIFVNLMRDRREGGLIKRENIVIGALVAGFVLSGIMALVQNLNPALPAPKGFWTSPNLYGAFVAFLLPFLDEIEIPNPRFEFVPLGLTLFSFGIVWLCVASPFAAIAAFIGLIFAWAARPNAKRLHIMRLAVVLLVGTVFAFTWKQNPQLRTEREEFARVASDKQKVKKQIIEWEVASRWNYPKERAFATGVGPGNYQLNIGPLYGYDSIPNEEKMPPDSNNMYLVQAVSIGILGLGALLWVLWHFIVLAWRGARAGSWIGAGVFGSLIAWIFVNPFHAMIVRGAGLLLALFFALAVIAASNASSTDKSNTSEL